MAIIFYIFQYRNYITLQLRLPVLDMFPHAGKKIGSKRVSFSFSASLLQVGVIPNFLPGKLGYFFFFSS